MVVKAFQYYTRRMHTMHPFWSSGADSQGLTSRPLHAWGQAWLMRLGLGLFRKSRRFTILRDASGVLKPGRLTLLLGPPGSGKTTLLKALSGKLHKSNLKVRTPASSLLGGPPDTEYAFRACSRPNVLHFGADAMR